MNPIHEGAAAVVRWMLSEGRYNTRMREFGAEMCRRIIAAGIPIWRGMCVVGTLHPQIMGTGYIWRRDGTGATRWLAEHGLEETPEFANSPIAQVRRTAIAIRRKLEGSAGALDFAVLEEFRREGGTDYVALPLRFSDGNVNCITDRKSVV